MRVNKIAIVTPLKDELQNIEKLINSIKSQSVEIYYWLIVENDSSDGSREYLSKIKAVNNVVNFKVINIAFENKKYELGIKYSSVVNTGFEYLKNIKIINDIDFIGILDADCIPQNNYYEILLSHFHQIKQLGVASGTIKYEDGTTENANEDHARGGCRLWNIECFNQCPYEIGMSADSISAAKAIVKGWKVLSFNEAIVESRKAGSNYISTYGGLSAYYRYIPFYYITLKAFLLLIKGHFKKSFGYFFGYIEGIKKNSPRLQNDELKKYYKSILLRKIRNRFHLIF